MLIDENGKLIGCQISGSAIEYCRYGSGNQCMFVNKHCRAKDKYMRLFPKEDFDYDKPSAKTPNDTGTG
jgi:hypothetical protein